MSVLVHTATKRSQIGTESVVNNAQKHQSHRFVVVYRSENRELENAAEIWRGWVERIPDPRQRELDKQNTERLGFQALSDLPHLIEELMDRAAAMTDAPSNRRPQT